jgi:hypothetical protein
MTRRPIYLLPAAILLLSGCIVDGKDYRAFYESCGSTSDCVGGADACFTVDWIDGRGTMCSMYCDVHEDCPGWSSCWELVGDPTAGQRVCYARCDTDFDCYPGFICVDALSGSTPVDAICMPN